MLLSFFRTLSHFPRKLFPVLSVVITGLTWHSSFAQSALAHLDPSRPAAASGRLYIYVSRCSRLDEHPNQHVRQWRLVV